MVVVLEIIPIKLRVLKLVGRKLLKTLLKFLVLILKIINRTLKVSMLELVTSLLFNKIAQF